MTFMTSRSNILFRIRKESSADYSASQTWRERRSSPLRATFPSLVQLHNSQQSRELACAYLRLPGSESARAATNGDGGAEWGKGPSPRAATGIVEGSSEVSGRDGCDALMLAWAGAARKPHSSARPPRGPATASDNTLGARFCRLGIYEPLRRGGLPQTHRHGLSATAVTTHSR